MYSREEFDAQKTKVLKFILYKKRTESEVRNKFLNIIDEDMLEDIIEYLKQAQYIDDKSFIEKEVKNYQLLKNLSVKEIQYKLLSKGLNKDDIEDYIYNNKDDLYKYERKSINNIVLKKQNDMSIEDIKLYLYKKGYKSENINIALENITDM